MAKTKTAEPKPTRVEVRQFPSISPNEHIVENGKHVLLRKGTYSTPHYKVFGNVIKICKKSNRVKVRLDDGSKITVKGKYLREVLDGQS